jgi:DNA-binding response OmpR family regulator
MALILIADDDESACRELERILSTDGHTVHIVHDGVEALSWLRRHPASLIIGDAALPGMDGMALCRRLRAEIGLRDVAALILADRATVEERIAAFESGCDDYILKPFQSRELCVRVRALLRRAEKEEPPARLGVGDLSLDPATFQVRVQDRAIALTRTEFELLSYMAARAGQVLPSEHLLTAVWNYPPGVGDTSLVRMHIKNLREKIESAPQRPRYIQTVSRHGYMVACGEPRPVR